MATPAPPTPPQGPSPQITPLQFVAGVLVFCVMVGLWLTSTSKRQAERACERRCHAQGQRPAEPTSLGLVAPECRCR